MAKKRRKATSSTAPPRTKKKATARRSGESFDANQIAHRMFQEIVARTERKPTR